MFIKLEKFNPGGSVKDRITKYMIQHAEKNGQLKKGMTVIEATSGNTGIGLALVCRVKGYHLDLVMPDTMTRERRQILLALGAKVILSEGSKGMDGAEDLAHETAKQNPSKYFIPDQFANQANVLAHYETTAEEIWRDTEGKIVQVDYRHMRIFLDSASTTKADGKEVHVPVHPSNLLLVKPELDDDRKSLLEEKGVKTLESD